jgi:tetratricopeptide (TPR) repeat protein
MKFPLLLAGLLTATLMAGNLAAQNGKYGATPEDSVSCVQNLSLYQEFFNQKNYADALGPWRNAMRICPTSSKRMYLDGVAIRKYFAGNEKEPAIKAQLLDSMYMVYDQRIEYFGQRGYVLGRKGVDMLIFSPDRCPEIHAILKESVDLLEEKSEAGTLAAYYQSLSCLYDAGDVTKEDMLREYIRVITPIDAALADPGIKPADVTYYESSRDAINGIFFKVADCADIGRIVGDMIQAKPDDIELKKRMLRVLNSKDCTDETVYFPLAEAVHKADPSSESAYSLGMYLAKQNDLSGATRWFKEAVDLCEGCTDEVKYLLRAGQVAGAAGNHALARSYANRILQIDGKNGEALILIGNAIAAAAAGCDEKEAWGAYWLAYDYYQKARTLDPSVAEKASARMSSSKAQWPTTERMFFHQVAEGSTVQVTCGGGGESTQARAK